MLGVARAWRCYATEKLISRFICTETELKSYLTSKSNVKS